MHNGVDPSQIWRVREDPYLGGTFGNMLLKNDNLGVENWEEEGRAFRSWLIELDQNEAGGGTYETMPLPPGFPKVVMYFPSNGFAPDYFSFGSYKFCSARLRDVLAQPSDVVNYTPIDFRCQGTKALAQDYQRMRVIAVQPAMDMARSLYTADDEVDPASEDAARWVRNIDKIVLREDFVPRTEIFCMAERITDVLATDALAERVLKAGCTGLSFEHLETPDWTSGIQITVRTKRGTRQRG